jgi:hypothetical protein
MSSNQKSSSNKANTTDTTQPKDYSNYRMIKEAGFDNMLTFMASYGLKIHDDEQLAEGKAILEGLRQCAQHDWEAKQRRK